MASRTALRPLLAGLFGVSMVALLAGCETGGGFGGGAPVGEFAVLTASPERAVLSAQGQRVAVEPASGFCVAEDSIETSDRSAFVLIGDCALASGGMDLSSSLPGITTVSISGDPGFAKRGGSAADLSALERYLATPEGRALLGRGGDGSQVSIVETRREGNTLFVLVEDRSEQLVPLLASRFWRGFVELNDRLTVVTVSGFHDAPMDEDQMLRHLGTQVRQLQLANAAPIEEPAIQIAEARPTRAAAPAESAGRNAPSRVTTPAARPASGAGVDEDEGSALVAEAAGTTEEPPARIAWGSIPDWPPKDEAAGGAERQVAEDEPTFAAAPPAAEALVPSTTERLRSQPVIERSDDPAVAPAEAPAGSSGQPMPTARPAGAEPPPARTAQTGGTPTPTPAPRLSDSAVEAVGSALAGSSAPLPPKRAQR